MSLENTKILMVLPVYFQKEKVIKSLDSVLNLRLPVGVSADIAIGVNGADPALKLVLEGYLPVLDRKGCFSSAYIKYFDINIGKGPSVNTLYQEMKGKGYDFILSSDSDIIYPNSDTIALMLSAFKNVGGLGGIAAEQIGNCCHWKHNHEVIVKGDLSLRYYRENQGVAGGVLLIPTDVWEKVGGYKTVPKSTYGGNDAFFMRDCFKNHLNVPVLENAKVFHPSETNPNYASWKRRSCRGDLSESEKNGFLF